MTILEYMDEHNQYDVFMLIDQNLEVKFYVYVGCDEDTNIEKLVNYFKENIELDHAEDDEIFIDFESYVSENKSHLLRIRAQERESDQKYAKGIAEIIESAMTGYVSEQTAKKVLIILETEEEE